MRGLASGFVVVFALAGCQESSPCCSRPATPVTTGCGPTGCGPTMCSPITITPAAREQLRSAIAAQPAGVTYRLRITLKPGGCQGFRTALDLDPAEVGAGEVEILSGDVRCLATADQADLVRGALVDWVRTLEETGFTVTFPNRTVADRKKSVQWINRELGVNLFEPAEEMDDADLAGREILPAPKRAD